MRKDYLTVKGYGQCEIILSKSRFITYIERAESEQEALDFIDKIKNGIFWSLARGMSLFFLCAKIF